MYSPDQIELQSYFYIFSARPSTASAASRIASESDGCGWQMRAISSDAALNSIALTASAIKSDALLETICTPRISSLRASASISTTPSACPMPSARPLAANGNCPVLQARPSRLSLEFVKADQTVPLCKASGQGVERI